MPRRRCSEHRCAEPLGEIPVDLFARNLGGRVVAAFEEDGRPLLKGRPDRYRGGRHVEAADLDTCDDIDADADATGAGTAEGVSEHRVEPVHEAVSAWGLDLGEVRIQTDRLTAVVDPDEQRAALGVEEAGD